MPEKRNEVPQVDRDKYFNNKDLGISSIVMMETLHGLYCPLANASKYDAKVTITVLPTNKLADFITVNQKLKEHEGTTQTLEQLAAAIFRDIKAFYSSGGGYSAKAEIIVEYEGGLHMPVRIHIAG